jgi:hypothetical protein
MVVERQGRIGVELYAAGQPPAVLTKTGSGDHRRIIG